MKQNVVIIPVSNEFRIRKFDEFFNIFNIQHNYRFILVCEDRRLDRNEFLRMISTLKHRDLYDVKFMNDVIDSLEPTFNESKFYRSILKEYPLSVKLLLMIYSFQVLNLDKVFLLDDDTMFLIPADALFERNDITLKKDPISYLCNDSELALSSVFDHAHITSYIKRTLRCKINSGSIISTNRILPHLLQYTKAFFNSAEINKFFARRNYLIASGKKRDTQGRSWLLEQVTYGLIFALNDLPISFFSSGEVNTGVNKVAPNTNKKLTKIPNIVHFLPRDKEVLYDYFLKRLSITIKND